MELTVLGSGTGIPSPRRGSPSFLLRAGGRRVLVDCGPGALRAAAGEGVGPGEIDAVLVTHFHPDHTLDLQALLFALRNFAYAGRPPLVLAGPPGLGDLLEHWYAGEHQGRWLRPGDVEVEVRETGPGRHDLLGLEVRAIPVLHSPESQAYRVREGGGEAVLALSGDTGLCEGVVEAGRGAALLVLECAFPDPPPWEGHLSPEGAALVAERADPARLVLTHFYPEVESEPIVETVRRRYRGPVSLAEDGETFHVG